jgi:TPR repeat protein
LRRYGQQVGSPDPDEARQNLTPAAKAGDSTAMFALGILEAQRGDQEAAVRWWERAEMAGNCDAWLYLGRLLRGYFRGSARGISNPLSSTLLTR